MSHCCCYKIKFLSFYITKQFILIKFTRISTHDCRSLMIRIYEKRKNLFSSIDNDGSKQFAIDRIENCFKIDEAKQEFCNCFFSLPSSSSWLSLFLDSRAERILLNNLAHIWWPILFSLSLLFCLQMMI